MLSLVAGRAQLSSRAYVSRGKHSGWVGCGCGCFRMWSGLLRLSASGLGRMPHADMFGHRPQGSSVSLIAPLKH